MYKILVADDEADLELLIRQKFRKEIREAKYDFLFVLDGKQALEMLQENPDVDMVLSDINMPRMDGLTLLQNLSENQPLLKSVIISAYGDMQNIRTAMNRGAFDFVTKPIDFVDLAATLSKTLRHVEQTRQTIRALKENNILKMYVDDSVLRFMSHEEFEAKLTENEIINATVMFADVCSFTSLSENQNANVVVSLLNQIFDKMTQEVVAKNGFVDKFIGDAIMAVFTGPDHACDALEAALNIIKVVSVIETGIEGYVPQVSIGVNTGEMVSGNIGSVTLRRLDFTVIGDNVNIAQRLQDVAQCNQVLINEAYHEQIKDQYECQPIGLKELKNKRLPAVAYEVLSKK